MCDDCARRENLGEEKQVSRGENGCLRHAQ